MNEQEVIVRLSPLPKGYKRIVDNQSADSNTIAEILPDGTTQYWRLVVDNQT